MNIVIKGVEEKNFMHVIKDNIIAMDKDERSNLWDITYECKYGSNIDVTTHKVASPKTLELVFINQYIIRMRSKDHKNDIKIVLLENEFTSIEFM